MSASKILKPFDKLLASGLAPFPTTGLGNCLFNALSDQLYGSECHSARIRAIVVQHMRENENNFKSFITVQAGGGQRRTQRRQTPENTADIDAALATCQRDISWDIYLREMAKSGTFADELEVQAFVKAFGVSVRIYKREMIYESEADTGPQAEEKWALLHLDDQHYSSIRPIGQNWVGLENIVAELPKATTKTPEEGLSPNSIDSAAQETSSMPPTPTFSGPSEETSSGSSLPISPPLTPKREAPKVPSEQKRTITKPEKTRCDPLKPIKKPAKKDRKARNKKWQKICERAGKPEEASKEPSEQMCSLMEFAITSFLSASDD